MAGDDPRPVDEHVRTEVVGFVRALRRQGVDVPANAGVLGARALREVGLSDRSRARTALRTTLLSDPEDFDMFDHLFSTFWARLTDDGTGGGANDSPGRSDQPGSPVGAETPTPDATARQPDSGSTSRGEAYQSTSEAAVEHGRGIETAVYSPAGTVETVGGVPLPGSPNLDDAFRILSQALSGRRGRRYRAGGDRPAPRRLLRTAVSTGGTPLSIPTRARQRSAVSALLLVDVSRSVLDTVDRGFLLEFLRRAAAEWRDVRIFFFDEDIREVTDVIAADSASAARNALRDAEIGWGGGTRIGASLARLHDRSPDAPDRRTVTFVISDGLEMGDVDDLEAELSWLSRRTKRIFWLNPLAAADKYEPSARGMAAALPYLDGLFAFASPADVDELARQVLREGPGGRIGYAFDSRRAARTQTTVTTSREHP